MSRRGPPEEDFLFPPADYGNSKASSDAIVDGFAIIFLTPSGDLAINFPDESIAMHYQQLLGRGPYGFKVECDKFRLADPDKKVLFISSDDPADGRPTMHASLQGTPLEFKRPEQAQFFCDTLNIQSRARIDGSMLYFARHLDHGYGNSGIEIDLSFRGGRAAAPSSRQAVSALPAAVAAMSMPSYVPPVAAAMPHPQGASRQPAAAALARPARQPFIYFNSMGEVAIQFASSDEAQSFCRKFEGELPIHVGAEDRCDACFIRQAKRGSTGWYATANKISNELAINFQSEQVRENFCKELRIPPAEIQIFEGKNALYFTNLKCIPDRNSSITINPVSHGQGAGGGRY